MGPMGDKPIEHVLEGQAGGSAARRPRYRFVAPFRGVEQTTMPAADRWRLGLRIALIASSAAVVWGLIFWAAIALS